MPKDGLKPTFTERPVIRQTDDQKIVFECRLVGEPLPEVVWFHDEVRLKVESSRRHKTTVVKADSAYLCQLEISSVEQGDAGVYKAVARNSLGEGTAKINLAFEEGIKKLHMQKF